jgi:hypothetical protein
MILMNTVFYGNATRQGKHLISSRLPALSHRAALAAMLTLACAAKGDERDLNDVLNQATTVPAPAADIPTTDPAVDALGTIHKAQDPEEARQGTLTLSDGTVLKGKIWTTLKTPFRVFVDETKMYNDIDMALVKHLEVIVDAANMEDDWRWLKEGSDQKIMTGKKYPLVQLRYKFALVNDQVITGGVVAPIFIDAGPKVISVALYKKKQGTFDQTMKDVLYVKSITFDEAAKPTEMAANGTRVLPLLPD